MAKMAHKLITLPFRTLLAAVGLAIPHVLSKIFTMIVTRHI
ncbi:uncharacterized protein METZ01_LOCUS56660 [marine metagenome]|uniref:Uncharacterized protein n=1 Tax=marine metagenome TaxID=408172 RepID=A0A381SIJ4_9ZZZZ